MGGGGFQSESTFHVFFFTFKVKKNMSKYWKRTINKGDKKIVHIKGGRGGGGGFEVGWT